MDVEKLLIPSISTACEDDKAPVEVRTVSETLGYTTDVAVTPSLWCWRGVKVMEPSRLLIRVAPLGMCVRGLTTQVAEKAAMI